MGYLQIPEMKLDLSTSRVLTMEFCEGEHINNVQHLKDHNIDTHDVSVTTIGLIFDLRRSLNLNVYPHL